MRAIQEVIGDLEGVVAYLDDIVVGGQTQEEHDGNLQLLLERFKMFGITLNSQKCKIGKKELCFLGHVFREQTMQPDPGRLRPLLDFPQPRNAKELQRLLGLLTYYAKWVQDFAHIAEPLFVARTTNKFPLDKVALEAIQRLKSTIANAQLVIPDPKKPLTLETDASGKAVGGVLLQDGRPISFVSHKLNSQERAWSAVELEAFAIVYSIGKLRQFLLGRSFTLITDQQSVAYLLDGRPKSKIKNAKINRWRLELAEFQFEIKYRPGNDNSMADALSRVAACQSIDNLDAERLIELIHNNMGHPGVQRTATLVKNLVQNREKGVTKKVKQFIDECKICAELKPRFVSQPIGKLVQSTEPWQRLSIDFMGPKPMSAGCQYIFTVVDECSRFLFAFPLKRMTADEAIQCLNQLFLLFGPPLSIHSDRGRQFEGEEFRRFLGRWNVTKTRTTAYHPQGNGQCERFNGTLWKTICLRLEQRKLPISRWKEELPWAVANIRALPCTALDGQSPHNRFVQFKRRFTFQSQAEVPQEENVSENVSIPPWLSVGKVVLLKDGVEKGRLHQVQVEKLCSPYHALVRWGSGRTDTVSTKRLSRYPQPQATPVQVTAELEMEVESEVDVVVEEEEPKRKRKTKKPCFCCDG